MDKQPQVLGNWIRAMRFEKGLTQEQVAERSNGAFRLRDVQQIEQGRRGILRPDRLACLLQTMDLDLGSLRQMRFDHMPTTGRIPQPLRAATRFEALDTLAANRERLQHAIAQAHLTCQRTTELMTASKQFAREFAT